MDKNKKTAILCYAAALLFYLVACLKFIGKGNGGVIYLCLGSAMLCCGSVYFNKGKKDEDKPENKDKDNDKPEKHE